MTRRILFGCVVALLTAGAWQASSAPQKEDVASFELLILADEGGAKLVCKRGCAWKEVAFSCASKADCAGIVDQNGVRALAPR